MTPQSRSKPQSEEDTEQVPDDARLDADQAEANRLAAEQAEREEAEAQALRDAAVPPPPGSLTVDVNSNLALATGEILVVGQKGATVADTAEVRALIAAGHLVEQGTEE